MRNTLQRQLILNAVAALNIHATAEQVYDYINRTHPAISKATVYRNLNQMAQAGELLNIGSLSGSAHYDHNCHEHYHFICKECERVFDIDSDFSDIIERAERNTSKGEFEIMDCHISFSGLCRACKNGTDFNVCKGGEHY